MRALQRYELDERIGSGGLAEVFRGVGITRDGERRLVMLKRLLEPFSRDLPYVERFWREARTASILQHPNVVELLDAGTMDGRLFLAWEYVDGADLMRILARVRESRRRLTVGAVLHIAYEILKALHHVHSRADEYGAPLHITHRELSPENVVISRAGEVKLADIGLARASIRSGHVISGAIQGDPRFMSPEQLAGTRVDERTDLYAAGMILYTLLAGEHPLGSAPLASLLPQILAANIPPLDRIRPDLPAPLVAATMRAIAPNPADRFATAQEFQLSIIEYANDRKIRLEGRKLADFLAVHFPGGAPEDELAAGPIPSLDAPFRRMVVEATGAEDAPVPEASIVRAPMKSTILSAVPIEELSETRRHTGGKSRARRTTAVRKDPMPVTRNVRKRPTVIRPRAGDAVQGETEESERSPKWEPPPAPSEAPAGEDSRAATRAHPAVDPRSTAESGGEEGAPTRGGTRASRGGGRATAPTSIRSARRPGPVPVPAAPSRAVVVPSVPSRVVARAIPARRAERPRDEAKARWLEGHDGGVSASAFLADGRHAVTAGQDQRILVWDLKRGTIARELRKHRAAVTALAVSSDGSLLLSGARDRVLQTWDATSGLPITTLAGHKGWVFSVDVSRDGALALSSGVETSIRVWDLVAGRAIGTLDGHEDSVSQVVLLPDAKRALSGSRDGTVRLWDLRLRKELRVLAGNMDSVRAVAVSPDGRLAISAGADPLLRLWDLAKGIEIHRFEGHREPVAAVAFTPDGTRAVSGGYDGTVRVWDVRGGAALQAWEGHAEPVLTVAVSPDGLTALSGGADKRVGLWPVPRP